MDFEANQGPNILRATWTLVTLSFAFLVARLYCKARGRRGLWWDDYVLTVSWISLLISVSTVTANVPLGLGKHIYAAPVENLATIGRMGNVTGTFSILAAVWSKTSFALTLLRLLQGRYKALVWFVIVSCNIAMGLNAVFLWARCTPASKTWNIYEEGSCWAPNVYPDFGMFAAGYSAAMDFVLALLPWKIIWNLQMEGREKFGVAIAMSMGIFAGATAVVKTTEIPSLAAGDFTYQQTGLIIWGSAESAVTIMAASIPVLRTLFQEHLRSRVRKYHSQIFSESGAGSSRHAGDTDVVLVMDECLGAHPGYPNDKAACVEEAISPGSSVRKPEAAYGCA